MIYFRKMTIVLACLVAPYAFADSLVPTVLDLDMAITIALRDNPSIKAAEARVVQAQARRAQARSAYLPALDSSATASVTNLSRSALSANPLIADRTFENYETSLLANWLVFDGLGRKFRTLAARSGLKGSQASLHEAQRLLLSGVATAFYTVQLARENITIAEADREFNQRQLTEAQARRRVGSGSLSDELNFRVRVQTAESAVVRADRDLRVARVVLLELMGVSDAEAPETLRVALLQQEEPGLMRVPDVDPLMDHAEKARPDMMEARYLKEQTEAGVKIERSQFFPTVAAFASGDARRGDNLYFEGDDIASTVGVSVRYNIFSGGRRRAAVREAQAANEEVGYLVESIRIRVAAEVRRSLEILTAAQQELLIQRETTQFVERNRELVEREYRSGQGSLVRLNEAQRDLIAQRGRLALARVVLRQSWFDLKTATGETLESIVD
ncbi:MAG: TolC family protein [Candidatus Hydrogenedentes bacterium]|nr:TolC family protein [Candidatus Hydrogenedentota bacterium]